MLCLRVRNLFCGTEDGSKMAKRNTVTISTMGAAVEAEALTCAPADVDINKITAIQFYHELNMARRRKELTEKSAELFRLTCTNDLPLPDEVSADELEAETVASHKRIILTDKDLNVIHGHESVLIARESGEQILVLRIKRSLTPESIFLLQVRHAAKEGLLYPAVRMEVIRALVDDMKLELRNAQLLLVNPKGKKPSPKEVTSELRVGRLFEENPGYKIPFTGFELDKHSFSNLKYLVGNNTIFNEMQTHKDNSDHFLRMAITATKTRSKRLNTEVPPLMKYPDTKDILFGQGLPQSKALLRAKYPEENQAQHPQNDLVSANQKLKNTDTLILIKHQIENNPSTNSLLRQIVEINCTMSELSPNARREILRALFEQAPQDFADILIDNHPELAVESLNMKKQKFEKLLKGVH